MNMRDKLNEVEKERERLKLGGGPAAIEKQHQRGKLTARERIDLLLDPGTFAEVDVWAKPELTGFPDFDKRDIPADAVITGCGEVGGRPVYLYAHDFTVASGTFAPRHVEKVLKMTMQAIRAKIPIFGLVDTYAGRIPALVRSAWRVPYFRVFYQQVMASGVVPQISLLLGPGTGGAAYSPMLTDFLLFTRKTSYMYVITPASVKTVTFVDVTDEEMGGAEMHARVSGSCDVLAEDDADCIGKARDLFSFLPQNNRQQSPVVDTGDDPNRRDTELLDVVPTDPRKVYDMHLVIKRLVDNGHFFEIKREFAPNMVCGFARLGGRPVGIVANNPLYLAGSMDIDSSDKQARFIRTCDAFNIPLVFLADTPGFIADASQERAGLIRHGTKVLYAIAEASVPKLTVVTRKWYGGAVSAMCDKPMGADLVVAWPTAECGGIGAEAAVDLIYRREIAGAKDPAAARAQKLKEYNELVREPFYSAGVQYVEDIIDPRDTRPLLIKTLKALSG
ncbi:MAG: acyl-CoA carboxylase subunit beta, partial [Chloroflexota bacterium]